MVGSTQPTLQPMEVCSVQRPVRAGKNGSCAVHCKACTTPMTSPPDLHEQKNADYSTHACAYDSRHRSQVLVLKKNRVAKICSRGMKYCIKKTYLLSTSRPGDTLPEADGLPARSEAGLTWPVTPSADSGTLSMCRVIKCIPRVALSRLCPWVELLSRSSSASLVSSSPSVLRAPPSSSAIVSCCSPPLRLPTSCPIDEDVGMDIAWSSQRSLTFCTHSGAAAATQCMMGWGGGAMATMYNGNHVWSTVIDHRQRAWDRETRQALADPALVSQPRQNLL